MRLLYTHARPSVLHICEAAANDGVNVTCIHELAAEHSCVGIRYMFMIAHEVCHGTVTECLRDIPAMRSLALHLTTIPAFANADFEYYSNWQ